MPRPKSVPMVWRMFDCRSRSSSGSVRVKRRKFMLAKPFNFGVRSKSAPALARKIPGFTKFAWPSSLFERRSGSRLFPELSATPEPVSGPATAIGTLPAEVASAAAGSATPDALISIKVADTKKTTIPARDALQYVFGLPDTDQKCRLVGSTKGVGGFGRNIEVFLLSDADYVFWNANPAAIAPSQWETYRGSENTLDYELREAGTYHFVVSNQMSPTPQAVAVKVQVKCVK